MSASATHTRACGGFKLRGTSLKIVRSSVEIPQAPALRKKELHSSCNNGNTTEIIYQTKGNIAKKPAVLWVGTCQLTGSSV